MAELSWKIVLYPHNWIGHIDIMAKLAEELGYPYFLWNGVVYKTDSVERTDLSVS